VQFIGPRKHVKNHVPHNLLSVFISTGLLWFGWLAFNGGSNVAPTSRAAIAAFNSMLAPSVSALTWTLIGKGIM
jgi:Amt family ammonium transporter